MNKLLQLVLLLSAAFSVTEIQAQTAPDYIGAAREIYSQMSTRTAAVKTLTVDIRKFNIPTWGTPTLQAKMDSIYPLTVYTYSQVTYVNATDESSCVKTFSCDFYGNDADERRDGFTRFSELATTFFRAAEPAMKPYERVLSYHDVFANATRYRLASTLDWHVFADNSGLCDVYSDVAEAILNKEGVETQKMSVGPGMQGHAWDHVKIGDHWFPFDVTRDGRGVDYSRLIIHSHLLSNSTFNYNSFNMFSIEGGTFSELMAKQGIDFVDQTYQDVMFRYVNAPFHYSNGSWYYVDPNNSQSVYKVDWTNHAGWTQAQIDSYEDYDGVYPSYTPTTAKKVFDLPFAKITKDEQLENDNITHTAFSDLWYRYTYMNDRIYYYNWDTKTIESMKLDGTDKKTESEVLSGAPAVLFFSGEDLCYKLIPTGTLKRIKIASLTEDKFLSTTTYDRTFLKMQIINCQLLDYCTFVGTEGGETTLANKTTLKDAIAKAKAVNDNASATAAEVDAAYRALVHAYFVFKSGVTALPLVTKLKDPDAQWALEQANAYIHQVDDAGYYEIRLTNADTNEIIADGIKFTGESDPMYIRTVADSPNFYIINISRYENDPTVKRIRISARAIPSDTQHFAPSDWSVAQFDADVKDISSYWTEGYAQLTPLSAPTNLKLSSTGLTWTASTGAEKYMAVLYKNGSEVAGTVVSQPATLFADNLKDGGSYVATVSAIAPTSTTVTSSKPATSNTYVVNQTVEQITIDVKAPVTDAEPSVTLSTASDAQCAIVTQTWSPTLTNNRFAGGVKYKLVMKITPKAGYLFSKDTRAASPQSTPYEVAYNADGSLTCTISTFEATKKTVTDAIKAVTTASGKARYDLQGRRTRADKGFVIEGNKKIIK